MRSVEGRVRTSAAHGVRVVLLALAMGACGDEGPVSAPGILTATVVSPNGAEGAALVTLVGVGMGAVGPSDEGRVFAEAHGDTLRVVVVNVAGGALRFTIQVADTTKPPAGTLVEVSGPDDRIRGLTRYTLELRP
jgi:hypothetical protein